jgi:hypothetical protein
MYKPPRRNPASGTNIPRNIACTAPSLWISSPLCSSRLRREGEAQARRGGPARSRQGQGRPFREPSEPSAERGNPGFWGAEPGAMALGTLAETKVPGRAGAGPR